MKKFRVEIIHSDVKRFAKVWIDPKGGILAIEIKPAIYKTAEEYCTEGCDLVIDVDKEGSPVCFEVTVSPSRWQRVPDISPPQITRRSWIRFCRPMEECGEKYLTNGNETLLYIKFLNEDVAESLEVAKNLIVDITKTHELTGIWILNIPPGYGSRL